MYIYIYISVITFQCCSFFPQADVGISQTSAGVIQALSEANPLPSLTPLHPSRARLHLSILPPFAFRSPPDSLIFSPLSFLRTCCALRAQHRAASGVWLAHGRAGGRRTRCLRALNANEIANTIRTFCCLLSGRYQRKPTRNEFNALTLSAYINPPSPGRRPSFAD